MQRYTVLDRILGTFNPQTNDVHFCPNGQCCCCAVCRPTRHSPAISATFGIALSSCFIPSSTAGECRLRRCLRLTVLDCSAWSSTTYNQSYHTFSWRKVFYSQSYTYQVRQSLYPGTTEYVPVHSTSRVPGTKKLVDMHSSQICHVKPGRAVQQPHVAPLSIDRSVHV